jgi:plastocyanin
MRAFLARTAILLIPATAGSGCSEQTDPDPSVLTTVQVTPPIATLFTVAPVSSVALTVVAKDQRGQVMPDVGQPEFSSDDDAVATVGDDGTVTAIGTGTALITASVTAGGVTASGTVTVTVLVAPDLAAVQVPALAYEPPVVDVAAGGSVTWNIGAIHHTVTFSDPNAPEDIPESQSTSVSRSFPTAGAFGYRCLFHPQMVGSVRVH